MFFSACGLLGAWVALAAEDRATVLASTGPAGGSGPYEAEFAGATPDGAQVFFWTEEPLVAGDTNLIGDLYRRSGGETTQISAGPSGSGTDDAELGGTSADGSRVFFVTSSPLVEADLDESFDVYEFSGSNDITLVSTGPAAKKAVAEEAEYAGGSSDGSRVFFETAEPLVAGDTDESVDVYERSGGVTTLLSVGPEGEEGQGPHDAQFAGASADGTRVFFETYEALDGADEDAVSDVYERFGGETAFVSVGDPTATLNVGLVGLSEDGERAILQTSAALTATDTDEQSDVFERFGGVTKLVSVGPTGGNAEAFAAFEGASADGTRVFFRTTEQLVEGDTDNAADSYERLGGLTTLLSTGPAGGNENGMHASALGFSSSGDHVFFATDEQLVAADTDGVRDVYERSGGATALVSTGPAGGGSADLAFFQGNSADGSRVFFTTHESLVAADTDEESDVYERAGGVTTLVSTGPAGGNGEAPAFFAGNSADGTRVFLETAESLLAGDADVARDVYVSELPAAAEEVPSEPAPASEPPPAQTPAAEPTPAEPRPPDAGARPRCLGKPATIVGTGRRDVLKGTRKRDVIVARGGNDKILAFGGNDLICAGRGKDMVKAGAGNDRVVAGAGADRAFGQAGNDRLFGQGGNDLLFGNAGRDLLNGGAQRDRCRGGGGKDRLRKCER